MKPAAKAEAIDEAETVAREAAVRRLVVIAALTVGTLLAGTLLAGTLLAGTLLAQAPVLTPASHSTSQPVRELYGTVSDDAGRPIAGVEVTLRDKNGAVSTVTTTDVGRYHLTPVPDALFAIGARQSGFAPVAQLLREAPDGALDLVLTPIDDEEHARKVERTWHRDLELYDRAMKVAVPSGVLLPADFALAKTSFTGDLLNLLPGFPRQPARTASRCAQVLLNDFPQGNVSVNQIPVQNLKLVMVRTPGNPLPDAWRPFVYSSACTVLAVYTL